MRVGRDSVSAVDIPVETPIVLGYVSQVFAWSAADWARFPHSLKWRIATQVWVNDGDWLDVETGDATPEQSITWVLHRRAQGHFAGLYVNRSNIDLCRSIFAGHGEAQPPYWLSTLDGALPWGPGIVGIQYRGERLSGGHYDESLFLDHIPGLDAPAPGGETEMMTLQERMAWVWDGFVELFGRNPSSTDELMAIVNVVKEDRTNLYDVRVSMWNDPRAVAYRKAKAAAATGSS